MGTEFFIGALLGIAVCMFLDIRESRAYTRIKAKNKKLLEENQSLECEVNYLKSCVEAGEKMLKDQELQDKPVFPDKFVGDSDE